LAFGILGVFGHIGGIHFPFRSAINASTATSITVPANLKSSFATTQALWRFLANDKVTLKKTHRIASGLRSCR